jgi:hypothetical protein
MGAPKKPRQKAPKKDLLYPKRSAAQVGKKNYFATLMETEEGRELRRQWSTKPRKNGGRPMGVVDGFTKEMLEPIRAQSRIDAERIVKVMAEEYDIDDSYAKEALQTAIEIMREPAQNRDKLTAARMILDFTKSKPTTKSEVTIGKAEAFLSSLLEGDIEEDSPDEPDNEE